MFCFSILKARAREAECYEQPQCLSYKPVRRCFSMVELHTPLGAPLVGVVRMCKSFPCLVIDGVSKGKTWF